jgi:histidine ammonia-lyase
MPHPKRSVLLGSGPLPLEEVEMVARGRAGVKISSQAARSLDAGRRVVEDIVSRSDTVYGITTGFGRFAEITIPPSEIERLQVNLVRSHATGVGPLFVPEQVRAVMLLQANKLCRGASGVRRLVVEMLAGMLNRDVVPLVPQQGSVGASGDLAPMAHIALAAIGRGRAWFRGREMSGARALGRAGLRPLKLKAKEGLALTNGTEVMTAVGVLALLEGERLSKLADLAGAMSLEALRGTPAAFQPGIHRLRPHPGQGRSAANLIKLLAKSSIRRSHLGCGKVQDAYCLRCMPQVHGASRDALAHVRRVLEVEANSVTDNPLVLEDGRIVSGGNFHGQPVALAMDFLGMALAELADISERRIARLLDPSLSGLPGFLTRKGGVNSGLMIVQNTAASLVSENKVLAHPASVDSIPTSANQEDHVSMGTIAARKASQIAGNTAAVLACELLCAAQGLEFLKPLAPGRGVAAALAELRRTVPPADSDREFCLDIAKILKAIDGGSLLTAAEKAVGRLG